MKLTKGESMKLNDWQAEVVLERNNLVDKARKLVDFLRSDPQIETKDLELLNQQVQAMKFYIQTLTERTVYFKEDQ